MNAFDYGKSNWPLLSHFVKFISRFNLPQDIESDPILATLMRFITAYDYQKLRRLSSKFYSLDSSISFFQQAKLVQFYLIEMGNLDTHPSNYRAKIYFKLLIEQPSSEMNEYFKSLEKSKYAFEKMKARL